MMLKFLDLIIRCFSFDGISDDYIAANSVAKTNENKNNEAAN